MILLRPYKDLGFADHGWLEARHYFSFAGYYDPERMNWDAVRVWNDDRIAPNNGFGMHPHRNMEIVTYIREGALTHEDSLGNKGRIVAGDVQVMSAGTGITHSEYNSESSDTRLFQIWIMPNQSGHKPAWGSRSFPKKDHAGQFVVLASRYGEDDEALPIHVDAAVLGAWFNKGDTVDYPLNSQRYGYLVVAKGSIEIENIILREGDGGAISKTDILSIKAIEDSEVVLVVTGKKNS
ncbi:MAG: pirin family protein [Zymomonas mobilis]|uniref:Pirin domain protein n=1 Tax=Zymomonas mobilis TaxID=542 RepID=A0A542W269_ZYMMB|nr:pirin family protein [Zymomonas mobilis]TQL17684.1 hypothetical protein FBY58_1282 [Zymomonas mobilis]